MHITALRKLLTPSPANNRGFTLVELLVVVVIIVALAAIAVPIFLNQKEKAQDGAAEAELAKVSRYLTQGTAVGLTIANGPVPSTIPGLGALEAPLTVIRLDPAIASNFCIRTTSESGKVLYWETGKGRTSSPSAYCTEPGDPTSPAPDNETPAPPESSPPPDTVVPLDTSDGTAELSGVGTFEDAANGAIIERGENEVRFLIGSANWQEISVTYPVGGGLTQTDTITKTSASTVGVLTRFSNREVRVSLPSTMEFTVAVRFSGSSTGIIYVLK